MIQPHSAPSSSKRRSRQSQTIATAAASTTSTDGTKIKSSPMINMLLVGLAVCCVLSTCTNLLHHDAFVHNPTNTALARAIKEFKQGGRQFKKQSRLPKSNNDTRMVDLTPADVSRMTASSTSTLAGLRCEPYGGPSWEHAKEMVYWRNIPSDQTFESPLKARQADKRQYLTFEPDGGGWNNIRMGMETIVGLAIAMGRTLVLPPAQGMYLLKKKDGPKQNTDFTFAHFFPMMSMAQENRALDIITMNEFLESVAMTGQLVDKNTGRTSYPPGNRTKWDGQDVVPLKEWLRNVTYIEHMWKPEKCLAAFPASGNVKDVEFLQQLLQQHLTNVTLDHAYERGQWAGVDAPPEDRLVEHLAQRRELCIYDQNMQQQQVVHFMCYHKMRIRYLVHFYAFLFFEDWRQDLWMKRFMRDHMRYMDEIQCAAARIVAAVRERAKRRGWDGGNFDTMHIRRGDFQFKDVRIEASEILKNSRDVLTVNKTVYVATDERDKNFFKPIRDGGYDLVFLDDFKSLLVGVNTNYFGMIDQLVASRGDWFLGCWHSTFTGFIMRMRGYHSTKSKLPGYEKGGLPKSFYYATLKNKYAMHEYQPLKGSFFNREFPTSWREIDKNVVVSNDDVVMSLKSSGKGPDGQAIHDVSELHAEKL